MANDKIQKIYREYFEIIDSFFGSIKHYLGDEDDSHIELGYKIASYPLISDLIADAIDDVGTEITNFWNKHAKTIREFITEQKTLKCVYSGDISPVILENFIKRSVLYIDTVILPDPLFNITAMQKSIISMEKNIT